MPVHWPFRGSSGDDAVSVGDPGLLYRQSLLRVVQAAGGAVDEAEPALAQIAASSAAEGKRRRALLKIALQPLLAVEKSQLFSEPQAARRTPAGSGPGKHAAPASWTNRHGGQPTSVLDADPQFDMGALMP
ncbi:hypothetical protein IWQ57_003094 [Coemansia nantahalensis]|uniref:Uncharacterized protein n=1 Tax=Coemansia nantahalensis TaxID=2789366 RepID=A0ACC1JYB7_9FUNG|nr:hypothetical protein IWQ57_003094 [Coemansia nantahalensis]